MAFPTVAGRQNSQTAANDTAHTVNFDTTPTTGDLLIVVATWDGAPTVTWPTALGTWTVINTTSSGTGVTQTARYKVAAGEGSSIALSTDNSEEMQTRAWRITVGTFTGSPEKGTAATSTGDNNPNPPNCIPSWGSDDNLWIAAASQNNSGTMTGFPANFGIAQSTANSGGAGGVTLGAAERELAAASLNPGTFTSDIADRWVTQTIVVRGVAAAASPLPVIISHGAVHRASSW